MKESWRALHPLYASGDLAPNLLARSGSACSMSLCAHTYCYTAYLKPISDDSAYAYKVISPHYCMRLLYAVSFKMALIDISSE